MKNLSLTRLVLAALFILSSLKIFAAEPDFQVNGIYYKITSIEKRECSLCGPVNSTKDFDKLIIPAEVEFNGASFTIVSVFGEPSLKQKVSKFVRVKELILPNTVTSIEEYAFYDVPSLEKIQMDGVEYISSNAFERCENLKTISIALNRLKNIGVAAFRDCHSLEEIIIPPSCKMIEGGAFVRCGNSRFTVVIEDSDEPLICNSTFDFGKKIYIGRNLQGWNGYNHYVYQGDIYYFKEIEFGDKVTEMLVIDPARSYYGDLDNYAFKITIGASIKVVPDFRNDNMTIKSLYLVSQEPPLGGEFSNRTYLHGTLYVPKGSLTAYKTASGWKNFLNIKEYETSRTINPVEKSAEKSQLEIDIYDMNLEAERKEEEARRASLRAQGYVDLGLPSGAMWKNKNEEGGFYTYDEAMSKFKNDLPTKEQLIELKDKCTWTWMDNGYKVMGPNGDSIFLPAAGYRKCGGSVYYVGSNGFYWSSTPFGSSFAEYLDFNSDRVCMSSDYRCSGLFVRLVR